MTIYGITISIHNPQYDTFLIDQYGARNVVYSLGADEKGRLYARLTPRGDWIPTLEKLADWKQPDLGYEVMLHQDVLTPIQKQDVNEPARGDAIPIPIPIPIPPASSLDAIPTPGPIPQQVAQPELKPKMALDSDYEVAAKAEIAAAMETAKHAQLKKDAGAPTDLFQTRDQLQALNQKMQIGNHARRLFIWAKHGRFYISMASRYTIPEVYHDDHPLILGISIAQLAPEYGNTDYKRAWAHRLANLMNIQIIEE